MQELRTLIDGKPTTVEIDDHNNILVKSGEHAWGFTPNLKPAYCESPNIYYKGKYKISGILLSYENDKIFSQGYNIAEDQTTKETVTSSREITPKNELFTGFTKALDALDAVSERTPLPEEIKDKLAEAYAFLGAKGPRK